MHASEPREVQGTVTLFGYDETDATATVLPRSVGWRALRAGAFVAGGLLLAPVVALLPPHVAWALAAAVTGMVLGARKWAERFTLLSLEGRCPRCGEPLAVGRPTRLRNPWTLDCEACHHAVTLTVPGRALEG